MLNVLWMDNNHNDKIHWWKISIIVWIIKKLGHTQFKWLLIAFTDGIIELRHNMAMQADQAKANQFL